MKGTLFALARNRNDIDANEKLKSMLYQVEATGAAFIDGKNILADSIFARHIQTGSITTEHMTAGSIKGDRIEVGTLNGDRITANTIKSNMIHTSGLDAGVIKTGTISAGNGVSVINMANGEFSLAGGKMGYVAATDRLYLGMGTLYMGELPIEEHNRMVGSRQSAEIQKTAITNEKQALDARYASIYNSSSLTGIPKTDLSDEYNNATTGYTARYNSLTTALNAVIEAPENTTIAEFATLQSDVATATGNYTAAVFSLNTALELASKTDISDQIETKSRTFTSIPVVPYNRGDIWKNGTSVYVCSTSRSTGSFLLSEWTLTADKTTVQGINDDPDTQRIEGRKMHFTNEVLMDNTWIDNLVANSIVVTKIQATELDAGKITAGTLSADRIAVGSLSGDKITANTIDATRLKIGSGAQGGYINNPRFSAWSGTYPDGTSSWSVGGISKVTVDTVPMAQFAPAAGAQQGMQLSSSYFANGIDLDGMQYFALECRFRLTSGTNPAGASFLVDIYRQDNSSERMQLDMKEVGTSVTINTWYVARKVFKLADTNVAKTFKSVEGYLLANWSDTGDAAKTIQFASVNMFQASAQEYLAQSWTNAGTTSINGGFIATGTLSADKITTGALNASLITTGNLDAARITTGVISAGNGKSTINMGTGAFSFGSGKIAFDGTTLSLNVDSLKITNSSVATETYASSAAATAKTEAISVAATDATSKVNSIEIGGRNLALGTSSDFTYATVGMYSGNLAGVATSQSIYTLEELGVQVGDTMTVSMYVGESEGGYGGAFRIDDQVGSNKYSTYKVAKNGYASETFTILEGTTEIRLYTAGIGNSGASEDFVLPVKEFKLEKGNKATAWMPAPEDVAYDIEQKADSAAVANAINDVSSSLSGAQAIANAKLDKSAYDNFIKEYGEYQAALAADQSVAAGNLQAAQAMVSSIQNEMGNMKESWTFNNGTKIEATGNGMLISDGNPSGMNMLLSQNRLSFFDGGVEVAYIADKIMKINHGIFVQSARIGSHLISTSPANSDITIVSFVGEG